MSSLSGKTAAVFGASGEFGASAALALAGEGAALVLGGQDRRSLKALQEKIERRNGRAAVVGVHPAKRHHPAHLIETARETFGKLDIVLSAVETPSASLSSLDLASWERAVDAGLKGFLYVLAAALPAMSEGGAVVCLSRSDPDPVTAAVQDARRTLLRALAREPDRGIAAIELVLKNRATPEGCAEEVLSALLGGRGTFSTRTVG